MELTNILDTNNRNRLKSIPVKKIGKTTVNKSENGVCFLTFDSLSKAGVVHGFSTREGGVSSGIYKSMNLSFMRGDEYENVRDNHRLFAEAVGYNYEDTVFSDQVHDTRIAYVTEKDKGLGMHGEKGLEGMDGLVTDIPDIPLMTFYADCVPLLFYDPVKRVIASSHSGWRGTVAGMGRITTEYLCNNMGCKRENIIAVIGPSICMDCYEVSEDVASCFLDAFAAKNHDEILRDKHNGKYQLNLWEANRIILENAGLKKENISMPDICTCHNPDIMISHRQTGGKRGNMAAVIML